MFKTTKMFNVIITEVLLTWEIVHLLEVTSLLISSLISKTQQVPLPAEFHNDEGF